MGYAVFLRHLHATRKASGLTQEEVAARMGKPQSFISKSVSGERRMDLVEIVAFCAAIDKPVTEFVAEFVAALNAQKAKGKPSTKKAAKKRASE